MDIFVSWLPVYHNMGLILNAMTPFFLAARLILLATSLQHVQVWLETIMRYRGTFTAAPDFAYRLCVHRIRQPQRYDLSSLRVALNAAEPVQAQTVYDFEAAFDLRQVLIAGYGLAESTVGVSTWPPARPMKVDTHGRVSVGRPLPEIVISVLRDGQPAATGEIGEVAIRSPANTRGYYGNLQATQDLFGSSNQVLSGDWGYVDAVGGLFIVGRKKNCMIQAGQTVYAEEVAEVVDALPGVRASAAVPVDRGGVEGEQVYIFAEARSWREADIGRFQALIIDTVNAFRNRLRLPPGRVYLVMPRTIPLTHNDKIQHQQLLERYLAGQLFNDGRILYPTY